MITSRILPSICPTRVRAGVYVVRVRPAPDNLNGSTRGASCSTCGRSLGWDGHAYASCDAIYTIRRHPENLPESRWVITGPRGAFVSGHFTYDDAQDSL